MQAIYTYSIHGIQFTTFLLFSFHTQAVEHEIVRDATDVENVFTSFPPSARGMSWQQWAVELNILLSLPILSYQRAFTINFFKFHISRSSHLISSQLSTCIKQERKEGKRVSGGKFINYSIVKNAFGVGFLMSDSSSSSFPYSQPTGRVVFYDRKLSVCFCAKSDVKSHTRMKKWYQAMHES